MIYEQNGMDISMTYHAGGVIKNSMDETIATAQRGDKEAFGLILEHHHRFVYKFVYAMLGEHSVAEEITQETFLAAFKGISSLRGDSALKTWLCGIAKNQNHEKNNRCNRINWLNINIYIFPSR